MSDSPQDTARWSRDRWVGLVIAIFGAHLAGLFLVSARHEVPPPSSAPRLAVRWLTSPGTLRQLADSLLENDPTLLATVNPNGFSGAAWLRPTALEFRSGEWTDTERSLADRKSVV